MSINQPRCRFLLAVITLLVIAIPRAIGQKADTIRITSKDLNTAVLREGTHRYLVYFRMKPGATRTNVSFWTRKIERNTYQGRAALSITQEWEDKDTIMHTVKTITDSKTMVPFYHEYWWNKRGDGRFDYLAGTAEMNGQPLAATDTARTRRMAFEGWQQALKQPQFNWHIDLETFPLLPFRQGVTLLIPFYDPGPSGPQDAAYTVSGSALLKGYDNQQVDCWLMTHESTGNKEVFWISKKTREVLKLEQEINGSMWRYKIKLGFSDGL